MGGGDGRRRRRRLKADIKEKNLIDDERIRDKERLCYREIIHNSLSDLRMS